MADSDSPLDQLRAWMEEGVEGYTVNWTTEVSTTPLVNWRALRQSDKTILQTMSSWKQGRKYVVDPLPERISLAFADFLFNEPPIYVAADETDQVAGSTLLTETKFGAQLRVAEDICVSEREVWWRIYMDGRQSLYPILDWTSRINVVPYMAGDTTLAAAFITDLGKLSAEENAPAYRMVEFHEAERVQNVLYEFKEDSDAKGLGVEVPLDKHPVTALIEEEWSHGLPILCGQVKNEEWMTSVYDGIEDFLLELNETWSIDGENFRLAGKKRAVLDKKYADSAGQAEGSEEILWAESDFNELDPGKAGPFQILEYDYDAEATANRLERLERAALTRVGLARQLVDANASEGLAQTGTALRVRLMPTVAAIRGKAKEWASVLPKIVSLLQQVDASEGQGHQWTNAVGVPSVTLQDPLPADAQEEATRHSTLMSANLESMEQALAELRPNWTKERRFLELCRILANEQQMGIDDTGTVITIERAAEFIQADPAAQAGSSTAAEKTATSNKPPEPGGARAGTGAGATPAPTPVA